MKTMLAAAAAAVLLSGAAFAQDALPSPDRAGAPFKVATPDFAKGAMASDLFEIRSSEIAKAKATSADVKAYADEMIADHTQAGKDLKAALGTKDPGAPSLAPKQAKMLQQLEAAGAAEFEPLYVSMQAMGHMETVALFRTYAGSGDDATVVALAKKRLPVIEMHTDMAQKLAATR